MGKYDSVGAGAAKGQRHYDEMALQWARLRQQRQAQNFEQQRAMALDNDKRYQHAEEMKQKANRDKLDNAIEREKLRFDRYDKERKHQMDERKHQMDERKQAIDLQKMAYDVEDKNRKSALEREKFAFDIEDKYRRNALDREKFAADRDDEMARREEWDIDNFINQKDVERRQKEFKFQVDKYNQAREAEEQKRIQSQASFAALFSETLLQPQDQKGLRYIPPAAVETWNKMNPNMPITGGAYITRDQQGRDLGSNSYFTVFSPRMDGNGKAVVDANGAPINNISVFGPKEMSALDAFFPDPEGRFRAVFDSTVKAGEGANTTEDLYSLYERQQSRAEEFTKMHTQKNPAGEIVWTDEDARLQAEEMSRKASDTYGEYEKLAQRDIDNRAPRSSTKAIESMLRGRGSTTQATKPTTATPTTTNVAKPTTATPTTASPAVNTEKTDSEYIEPTAQKKKKKYVRKNGVITNIEQ